MQPLRRKLLFELYKLMDLVILIFVLAVVLFFFSATPADGQMRSPLAFFTIKIKLINVFLLGVILVVWPAIFSLFGLYQSQRLVSLRLEFFNVLKAVGFGTLLFAAMSFIFSRRNITPRTLLAFWIICSLVTFFARYFLQKILFHLRKHGRNLRHVVVVGNGVRGHVLASELTRRKETGYKLVGFVDDSPNVIDKNQTSKIACKLDEFPDFLGKNVVDEVFITLPVKSYYNKISEVIQACEQQGIPVHFPVNFFNNNNRRSKIKSVELDGAPFIVHYTGHDLDLTEIILKRLTDIVVASILIVLLLPLFIVIALLIKVSSKGPVFFIQERVGYNKRMFKLLKFRTMVQNAEKLQPGVEHLNEIDGPIFKIKNDPRITKFGRFLRKTSLDELPQLINVLKGDMSLVGPRPLPLRDVQLFDAQWPKRRFSVRPGMTGLWQINGRSETKFDKLIKYDLEYIDNWSPWLDMKILLRTVPVVIGGIGAV
jgi:exopolysaccharide biosynthesis polyprenyl glycosylphosphotransferase